MLGVSRPIQLSQNQQAREGDRTSPGDDAASAKKANDENQYDGCLDAANSAANLGGPPPPLP